MHSSSGFVLFGATHLVTIAVVLAISIALPLLVRRFCSPQLAQQLAIALAVFLAVHEIAKTWMRYTFYGMPLRDQVPIHICNFAAWLTVVVLVWQSYRVYEVLYFWGLGGGIQALLTPDMTVTFPHPIYIAYYITHGLIIFGGLYATLVFGLRPTVRSIRRVIVFTTAYAFLFVAPINLLLGTNYLYLRGKPSQPSILDYLGPWPWYLVSVTILAMISFALYYSPFWVLDKLKARRARSV